MIPDARQYEYRILCRKDGKWRWGCAVSIRSLRHARNALSHANGKAGCRCNDAYPLTPIITEHYLERRPVGKWERVP